MMIRSFLPVGQGAFYTERFNNVDGPINVVYDCGSYTDVDIVKENIKNIFHEGESIKAVFISHFDDDHINGLPFLLQYCKVEYLFFPLLTQTDRKLTLLCESVNHGRGSVAYQFLNNSRSFLSTILENNEYPRLIGIRAEEFSQNNQWDVDVSSIPSGSNVSNVIMDRATGDLCEEWEYVVYNFRESERSRILVDELKKLFPEKKVEEILDSCKDDPIDREKIKKAYRVVPGSFNTNSLILFSGSRDRGVWQHSCDYYHNCFRCMRNGCDCFNYSPSGCLYMGDYDASGNEKWTSLKSVFKNYWDSIGCVQIPHHGSKHNYNSELGKLGKYHIVSVGTKNKYSHPHACVLHDILFQKANVNLVTEQRDSQVDFYCEW